MKSVVKLFSNKWMKFLLLIVLLQQILVAGGTYFLGSITANFPEDGLQLTTVLLLLLCITLPGTVFHYAMVWCMTKARKSTQYSYLKDYIKFNFNHPTHWRNEKSKLERHDMMCRKGQETVESAVHFFGDFAATSFNILLNTISIILVTDMIQGAIILVAGFLGLGIIHLSKKGIAETSRTEVLADNRLNGHLNRSWDNIVLGNQLFFDRWKAQFDALFIETEKASVEIVKKRDWSVSVAALVTNGLVLGSAFILIWIHQQNTAFVLAMLVMLPRSLQTVMHIQIIQSYFARWKNLQEKLIVTGESLSILNPVNLNTYIQPQEISTKIENQNVSVSDLENYLKNSNHGRFTITGQNGTGKSCLLLDLKNKCGLSALYLPSQHQLFLNDSQINLSSGELTLSVFKSLEEVDCKILLLDEWDANLSIENCSVLDKVIDQISQKKIVVEIRHSKAQINK